MAGTNELVSPQPQLKIENKNEAPNSEIFIHLSFHIIESVGINHDMILTLAEKLKGNGAQFVSWDSGLCQSSFSSISHIIATNIDFQDYDESEERMIPVVKPEWVYDSITKGRLPPCRPYSPDPKYFFSDVLISVTGLSQGDKEAIYGGVRAMGGQWMEPLTKITTHLVALTGEEYKCQIARLSKRNIKIVLPHWLDDCFKLRRRIDETPYLFPDPPILRAHSENFDNNLRDVVDPYVTKDLDPVSPRPDEVPESKTQFLRGRKFYLNQEDLSLSDRMFRSIQVSIENAGGIAVDHNTPLDRAHVDAFIGMYREGTNYVTASRNKLFVGNLTWLYWMLAHEQFSTPTRRLLHYPVVRDGLPEMKDIVIAATNYTGDARYYLEKLTEALGAKFTKSFQESDNFLICAKKWGRKYSYAKKWNIPVVNHLWLEETYAKWELQDINHPRYSHFPALTNLTEVVGQIRLDSSVLLQFYSKEGSVVPSPPNLTPRKQNSTPIGQPQLTVLGPNKESILPVLDSLPSTPSKQGMRRLRSRHDSPTESSTPRRSRNEKLNIATTKTTTPIKRPSPQEDQENSKSKRRKKSVLSNDSTSDSDKLTSLINSPETPLKTYKKKGKRLSSSSSRSTPLTERRSSTRRSTAISPSQASSKSPSRTTKPKFSPNNDSNNITVPLPHVQIKAVTTGWGEILSKQQLDRLAHFGILISSSDSLANVSTIFAPKICRTEKFLCAMGLGLDIISTNYINTVLDLIHKSSVSFLNNKLELKKDSLAHLQPDEYLFSNCIKPYTEKGIKINFSESTSRYKKLRDQNQLLFHGLSFNVTPNVNSNIEVIRRIIESHGGKINAIKTLRNKNYVSCFLDDNRYIMISKPNDKRFINAFKQAYKGKKVKCEVYDWNWIPEAIITMDLSQSKQFLL